MLIELSKSDKKLARELMSQSVEKEFALGMQEATKIIQQFKDKVLPARDAYHKLHDFMKEHRRSLSQRYDAVKLADYTATIAVLYRDKLITQQDLEQFSEEATNEVQRLLNLCDY